MNFNTFEKDKFFFNYLEDDHNRLAISASIAVANAGGKTAINPLVIYGQNGVGKTHLLNAIANEVNSIYPNKKTLFITSQSFLESYEVYSEKELRNFIRLSDILIVDDLDKIGVNSDAQRVLLGCFNYLHRELKQIVFSISQSLQELNLYELWPTLTRQGYVAEINYPDKKFKNKLNKLILSGTLQKKLDEGLLRRAQEHHERSKELTFGLKLSSKDISEYPILRSISNSDLLISLPNSEESKYALTEINNQISLYFDLDEFSKEEIANVIFNINTLYQSIGGDEIIIKGQSLLSERKIFKPVYI